MKDTPRHAGRLFLCKEDEEAQKTLHARRTKISQEKNLSLGTSSSLTKGKKERHPKSRWQTWLDGKEDEAAQKTFHARGTKISQEKNLTGEESQHALKLNQRENGTLQQI